MTSKPQHPNMNPIIPLIRRLMEQSSVDRKRTLIKSQRKNFVSFLSGECLVNEFAYKTREKLIANCRRASLWRMCEDINSINTLFLLTLFHFFCNCLLGYFWREPETFLTMNEFIGPICIMCAWCFAYMRDWGSGEFVWLLTSRLKVKGVSLEIKSIPSKVPFRSV